MLSYKLQCVEIRHPAEGGESGEGKRLSTTFLVLASFEIGKSAV